MVKKIDKTSEEYQNLAEKSRRISKIRSFYFKGNFDEFAAKLGVSTKYASGLCNCKEAITDKTLEKILKLFPEVNRAWLYFGEGDMLRTDNSTQSGSVGENSGIIVQHGDHSTYHNNSELLSVVQAQQETINRQSHTIATLTETNRQQSEQIGKLIEKLTDR